MLASDSTIMSLDVGGRRIGVAVANAVARIARPLTTLSNDDSTTTTLQKLIQEHGVAVLVVGLPQNARGEDTEQTKTIQAFVEAIKSSLNVPYYWQDEALTSQKAEAELQKRGVSYQKADVDAYAAMYILEDFLTDHPEVRA